jgi:hypothetical protein
MQRQPHSAQDKDLLESVSREFPDHPMTLSSDHPIKLCALARERT